MHSSREEGWAEAQQQLSAVQVFTLSSVACITALRLFGDGSYPPSTLISPPPAFLPSLPLLPTLFPVSPPPPLPLSPSALPPFQLRKLQQQLSAAQVREAELQADRDAAAAELRKMQEVRGGGVRRALSGIRGVLTQAYSKTPYILLILSESEWSVNYILKVALSEALF